MNPHEGAQALEHEHPQAPVYLAVAVVLTVLTVLEIAVFYAPFLQPVLVPLLIVLALAKFVLVAMFYMHLHYDAGVFTSLFGFPLLLALLIGASLLMLFAYLAAHLSPVIPYL
jgi:cytochrome c oxidase subunit 4